MNLSRVLKGLKRKNERGYRLKANLFSSWSRPMKVISDVPVSRNWYKTVSNLYELGLLLYLLFLFSIDFIHNIIYTSELLHQKIHQWQCSTVVTWYRQRHVISILLCHWWKFWSRDLSLRFSKFYIYEFSYNFNTVLYQFLETGTSDKTFMGRDQELKRLAFSLYPLSFFLYCPFKLL